MSTIDSANTVLRSRPVTRMVRGIPASDGAGVKLNRVIGTQLVPDIDPFLMLDEFRSDEAGDYIAGFPDHPHRGFETVTYMLAGRMRHQDNHGHSGQLVPGSVQWMTAGRGIVHSEMPEQDDGLMWGFQLWVNLPAKDKMCEPRYQEFPAESIPVVRPNDGIEVKLIAGALAGAVGPVQGIATNPIYWDVTLAANAQFSTEVPESHQAFLYVFQGDAVVGPNSGQPVTQGHAVVLGSGNTIEMRAGSEGTRLLLIAGRPLQEPVARYGPFVMNTSEEIQQAFRDYREGRF
jgi:redox-sensitive bicupin YhaK (pirin superfamily)